MALKVKVTLYGKIDRYQQYLKYHVPKDIQDPHGIPAYGMVGGDYIAIVEVRDDAILHEGLIRFTHGREGWYHPCSFFVYANGNEGWCRHYYADRWNPTQEERDYITSAALQQITEYAEDMEKPQYYKGITAHIVATYRRVKEWLGISVFDHGRLRWMRIPMSLNRRLARIRRRNWKRIFWILVGLYVVGVVIYYVNRARRL